MIEADPYKELEIPKFLKRSPSETPEERRKAWELYSAKRKHEMEIAAINLDAAIKDKTNETVRKASISSLVSLWNTAMDRLERPEDKVKSFRDSETAVKRVEGILVTLRTPAPRPDPNLKPVEETAKEGSSGKTGGSVAETTEQASGTAGKAGKGQEKAMTTTKNGKTAGKAGKKAKAERKGPGSKTPAGRYAEAATHHGNKPIADLKEAFGTREGSLREKLLVKMATAQGKQIALSDLAKELYRGAQDKHKGALLLVMNGLRLMIIKEKIPFTIVKSKNEKTDDVTFGLYSNK